MMNFINTVLDFGAIVFIVFAVVMVSWGILRVVSDLRVGSSQFRSDRGYHINCGNDNSTRGDTGSNYKGFRDSDDDNVGCTDDSKGRFIDFGGNWRDFNEPFLDGQNHYASWDSFQGSDGNWYNADSFKDGKGNWASRDDGFYDWDDNWVPGK